MKRAFVIVLSLAAFALGSKAQAQGQMVAPAGTKLGVIDMGKIYVGYKRVNDLKKDLDKDMEPFMKQKKDLEDHIKQWDRALRNDAENNFKVLTEKQREDGRRSQIDARRRLEDLELVAKKEMGKKVENMLNLVNKEINEKVKEVANAHGYQLILAFGEPDKSLPELAAFQRHMKVVDAGGMVVMYRSPSLDISEEVLMNLNNHYYRLIGQTPPPGTPVGGQVRPQ